MPQQLPNQALMILMQHLLQPGTLFYATNLVLTY